ncbi:M23 family metallopeptidase [Ammoniphilus sp. CFH 90114]|uniref:M23 family metallopeptidase n=1 Tax=Ammoniphilus sp. CFH 90114 TaxID=2493665 RepID=UPI00100E2CC5|nr:M23 family metallopeptidase [Ammoniphilus sp. CFH 90114]RXT04363.1 M23 family metallopeptidase [Ammoniphilus sp. CFH 90114]
MNGEQKQPIQPPTKSGWKAFFSKKWTFPAIYMGAAALILALIMWYQDTRDYSLDQKDLMPEISMGQENTEPAPIAMTPDAEDAVPVNAHEQGMGWPVAEGTEFDVVMNFYDEAAEDDVKAAALIQYEDSYWPHTGIDLATKEGQTFDVTAALPGKVTKAEKDPMVGFLVELEHADGLTTVYQSLEDLQVAAGDEVEQGAMLGKAGRNVFEKDLGVHLHFEVRENGTPVSPDKYLTQESKKNEAQ